MSDADRARRVQEAADAEHIIKSPVFKRVWLDLREAYIREAISSSVPDERLAKLTCIEVLTDVHSALVAKAMDGRIAEQEPSNGDFVV